MADLFYVDDAHVKALPINLEKRPYVYYTDSKGHCVADIYVLEEETLEKIRNIFGGKEGNKIKEKDKVFVLPGNSMPLARIKEFAKSKKATITKDISKATVICGNTKCYEDDNQKISLTNTLLFSTSWMYRVKEDAIITPKDYRHAFKISNTDAERLFDHGDPIFTTQAYREGGYLGGVSWVNGDINFIYPSSIEYLYYILSGSLPVVTEEYLTDNAHSGLDLSDEEVFGSIDMMLGSDDPANNTLGIEIVSHAKLDMDNPITRLHIWMLADKHSNKIEAHSRLKNVKHFINNSDWWTYKYHTVCDFARHAENNDYLTPDVFSRIFHKIKAHEEGLYEDSTFFEQDMDTPDYMITYKLKDKYLKLLTDARSCKDKTEIPAAGVA